MSTPRSLRPGLAALAVIVGGSARGLSEPSHHDPGMDDSWTAEELPSVPSPPEAEKTERPPPPPPPSTVPAPTQSQSKPTPPPPRDGDKDPAKDHAKGSTAEASEAQHPPDPGPPTLLGQQGKVKVGGYGGVNIAYTRLVGHRALLVGGEGAVRLDHCVSIGLGGMGLTTSIDGPAYADGTRTRLGLGYGGVVVRVDFVNPSPVYLSLGTLAGAGGLAHIPLYPNDRYLAEDTEDEPIDAAAFFVFEPSFRLDINLTRFARVGGTLSYRWVHGLDGSPWRDRDLRGVAIGGHLDFGWL